MDISFFIKRMRDNEKAEGDVWKVIDIAIGLVILFIFLGYVFAPVGSVGYNSAENIKTASKNITNSTRTVIAPNTEINTTRNNASANSSYTLYYNSVVVGSYLQNINVNTLRTTDGGDIYINITSITAAYSDMNIGTSSLYGISAASVSMWDSILPLVLAIIIIVLVYIIKKEAQ